MKFILALCLVFSVDSYAQRRLTPQVFQAKVRPVLNSMINDFYQMASLFPSFPKELVQLAIQIDRLSEDKEALLQGCPRILTENCLVNIQNLRSKLLSLQAKILELKVNQEFFPSSYITSLGGIRLMNQFQSDLEAVKGELDNTAFLIKAKINHRRESYRIIKQLDELRILTSLAVVEYIPFIYKEDFRHFFANFIHPIQNHVTKTKNYEFLNQNVNNLNIALNLLHMNLTKRNKETPDGMAPYLSLMHNRWNNLLRYYF